MTKLEELEHELVEAAAIGQFRVDLVQRDLATAVEVAFRHGARRWVEVRYPKTYKRLEKKRKAALKVAKVYDAYITEGE